MALFNRKFLPKAGIVKNIVADPLNQNPAIFALQWTRGPLPKERDSAESYWVSSCQYPKYDLSGPLKTNARHIEICRPAYAVAGRQFPNASINSNGIVNGQVYSQPLYDNNVGGYSQGVPSYNFPFGNSTFGDGISPAGAA